MSIADFLHQAGFWQWVGMLMLATIVAHGASRFRLLGDITKNKTKNIYTGDKENDK